jgi:hypothetical protein
MYINEKGDLNTKDRIDALMSLANFYREVRGARIRREWQVTFGLWVILATIAISATSIRDIPYWIVAAFIVVAFFLYLPWLRFHFKLHEKEAA